MATEKDRALLAFLRSATEAGDVRWEPTASENQFTASFKGKYNVIVERDWDAQGMPRVFTMILRNEQDGRELLTVNNSYDADVASLFEMAKRLALNVDAAIDEIMG